jgi:chromosome segregation ATPase
MGQSQPLHQTGDEETIKYLKDRIAELETEIDRQTEVFNAVHCNARDKRKALEKKVTGLEAEIAQRHEAMVERAIELDADKKRIGELELAAALCGSTEYVKELEENRKYWIRNCTEKQDRIAELEAELAECKPNWLKGRMDEARTTAGLEAYQIVKSSPSIFEASMRIRKQFGIIDIKISGNKEIEERISKIPVPTDEEYRTIIQKFDLIDGDYEAISENPTRK